MKLYKKKKAFFVPIPQTRPKHFFLKKKKLTSIKFRFLFFVSLHPGSYSTNEGVGCAFVL